VLLARFQSDDQGQLVDEVVNRLRMLGSSLGLLGMRTGRRPFVALRLGGASWLGRNVASREPRYLNGSAKRLSLTALSLRQRRTLFY